MLSVMHRRYCGDRLFVSVDIYFVPYYGYSVVVTIRDPAKTAVLVKAQRRAGVGY